MSSSHQEGRNGEKTLYIKTRVKLNGHIIVGWREYEPNNLNEPYLSNHARKPFVRSLKFEYYFDYYFTIKNFNESSNY